jgi:hypothetical protein
MTQEALKLALEALEANDQLINGSATAGGLVYCMDGYYSDCFDVDPINKQTDEAIAAIKEALAQPPRPMQECPNYEDCKGACFQCEYFNAETGTVEYPPLSVQPTEKEKISRQMTSEIVAARTLAQQEQEPVAWELGVVNGVVTRRPVARPQRTEQEPVAWQFMNGSSFRKRRPDDFSDLASDGLPYWKPLYTTSPQRTWVGLTADEQSFVFDQVKQIVDSKPFWVRFADAIEAKIKEKHT